MIRADRVDVAYGAATVLHGAGLAVLDGEVVGLIGPNGSGKTTLLRTLFRSLTPQRGQVEVGGTPVAELSGRDLARAVAVVVQEGSGELPLTVADAVLLGRTPHLSAFQRPSEADLEIAGDALARVGAEHLAHRALDELSGGERQRVLIARALAQQATHLLLDEPTNHLDIHYQHEVLGLVRTLGVTTTVVLHDLNLAARYCDRLVLLDGGRVAAAGTVDEVLDPRVLEPVYHVGVQRVLAHDGTPQLLFQTTSVAQRAAVRG